MFSVIIPAYNKARTLPATVESIFKQTMADYEIIIVDDGSTDDFLAAVEPLKADPRVRIIRQQNGGVSAARNTGIEAATRPFLCFLDADDEWYPNHLAVLEEMIGCFPDAGIYCTAYHVSHASGLVIENQAYFLQEGTFLVKDYFAYTEKLGGKTFMHMVACCVPRTAALEIGGFQRGVKIGEDTDFTLRIAAYYDVVLNNTITSVYHREESTATKDVSIAFDWYFAKREPQLLADERISAEERMYIQRFLERYRIHKCRHYLLYGERKKAIEVYKELKPDPVLRKERCITALYMLVPPFLLRRAYARLRKML